MADLTPALVGLAGAVIGAFVVHRLTKSRESAARVAALSKESEDRRREFRVSVRLIQHRLAPLDWQHFVEAWRATIPEFESACIRVIEDIPTEKREWFVSARDRYTNRRQKDGQHPAGVGLSQFPVGVPTSAQIQREMREVLPPILEEIIEYAK